MNSTSKKVFLSPSSMLAFIDRAHPKHDQASAFFRYFAQEQYQLFTDTTTITEVYTIIYKDISPSLAKDFLRTLEHSDINILYPDESDFKAALKTLVTYRTTDLGYAEALMAVQAYKQRIPLICTFDYLHPLFTLQVFFLPL
jgi:predicted nucleic acid-binding protein